MLTELLKQNALSFICKEWFFVVKNILYTIKCRETEAVTEKSKTKTKNQKTKIAKC